MNKNRAHIIRVSIIRRSFFIHASSVNKAAGCTLLAFASTKFDATCIVEALMVV